MNKQETVKLYERHADGLYRLCLMYMKNEQDALDVMQDAMVKLLEREEPFENDEHARRWLIRVCVNRCRDVLTHWWRKTVDVDSCMIPEEGGTEQYMRKKELLEEIMRLPRYSRLAVYLHFYEGYTTAEISRMLSRKESTVRSDLLRGRQKLKLTLSDAGAGL